MNNTSASAPRFASNLDYLDWEMNRLLALLGTLIGGQESGEGQGGLGQGGAGQGGVGQGGDRASRCRAFAAAILADRDEVRVRRRQATQAGVLIPFDMFSEVYELSDIEETILLIASAQHLSYSAWRALLAAQGELGRTRLEVGFLAQLLDVEGRAINPVPYFGAGAALIATGFIVLGADQAADAAPMGFLSRAVHCPHYVAMAILGQPAVDARLVSCCHLVRPSVALLDVVLPDETRQKVNSLVKGLVRRDGLSALDRGTWTAVLSGPRQGGKTKLAEALATTLGRVLYVVNGPLLARVESRGDLLQLAVRNAQMLSAVLLFVAPEDLVERHPHLEGMVVQLAAEYRGLALFENHRPSPLDERLAPHVRFTFELGLPDVHARLQLWESLLPPELAVNQDLDLEIVARTYLLTGGQIQAAMSWALLCALQRTPPSLCAQDIVSAIELHRPPEMIAQK